MSRRRSPGRSRRLPLVGGAILVAILSGCAPVASPDPQLVALQERALSLTRSAQLGEELRDDGRMFTTTTTALLSGMEQKLADVTREAALHRPVDAEDAAIARSCWTRAWPHSTPCSPPTRATRVRPMNWMPPPSA